MSEYSKGDYTKCYEDICEIWFEDNLYCIVRTDDADKIIDVLNENSELKRNFVFKDNLIRDLKYSMNRLSDENEQLKSESGKLNILYKAKCKTEEQLIEMGKEVESENEQLKHDATVLIQANQDYRKENEQLKQTNQRLNDELQECMGKLALKR